MRTLWEVPLAQPGGATLRVQTHSPTLQWTTAASFLQTPKDPRNPAITAPASNFCREAEEDEVQRKGTLEWVTQSSGTVTSPF